MDKRPQPYWIELLLRQAPGSAAGPRQPRPGTEGDRLVLCRRGLNSCDDTGVSLQESHGSSCADKWSSAFEQNLGAQFV
ncbi:hypothetical protein NDU88_005117 [Pleurodeles waltl]|uniref:Uncharacterized protein n=1 Tax=Pleurodeles waltl TaxID=8319 RepID=A0AAV7TAQ1_PLEWA|nr:hypothetical protein NDU88_005117 [Pleurodeles waltl]